MIDIHSHILYGIDDGPKEIKESLELLKQAIDVGYKGIVCSSHYYIGKYENKDYHRNFELLQREIKKEGLNIEIYKGNEFALLPSYSEHLEKTNRINGGRYLLVELKNELLYEMCKSFFKDLISQGTIPIFAHVERYPHIKLEELIELADMGVVLQVNIRMAVNPIKRIEYLLKKGYIGIVATDTHRLGKRDYNVADELEKLKLNLGEVYFNEVTRVNPEKIVKNENLEIWRGERDETAKVDGTRGIFNSLYNKFWRGKLWTK